jgi:hypothetical protein
MYNSILKNLIRKKILVFDLDGTITESKAPISSTMAKLLLELLKIKKIAIIGGGSYNQFQKQLLKHLNPKMPQLQNLFLFPTNATAFYLYQGTWKKIYHQTLSKKEKQQIKKAIRLAIKKSGYKRPKKTYGPLIEDRQSQITFSALGQNVVSILGKQGLILKKRWLNQNKSLKMRILKNLQQLLPNFTVKTAGYTSIDITKKNIDKAYGIYQITKYLKTPIKEIFFIGDAIFKGGNDYPVTQTGVQYLNVSGPKEVINILQTLLKKLKINA